MEVNSPFRQVQGIDRREIKHKENKPPSSISIIYATAVWFCNYRALNHVNDPFRTAILFDREVEK